MYVAQISIASKKWPSKAIAASDAIDRFLNMLRVNGQICGKWYPVFESSTGYGATAYIPERNALAAIHYNAYVHDALKDFQEAGLSEPVFVVVRDIDGDGTCRCKHSTEYILYTEDRHVESPLRCGDCFLPIPLYRIPPTYDNSEYYDITTWQGSYQACDKLYFLSRALEQAALSYYYDHKSEMDDEIARRHQEVELLRREALRQVTREQLEERHRQVR